MITLLGLRRTFSYLYFIRISYITLHISSWVCRNFFFLFLLATPSIYVGKRVKFIRISKTDKQKKKPCTRRIALFVLKAQNVERIKINGKKLLNLSNSTLYTCTRIHKHKYKAQFSRHIKLDLIDIIICQNVSNNRFLFLDFNIQISRIIRENYFHIYNTVSDLESKTSLNFTFTQKTDCTHRHTHVLTHTHTNKHIQTYFFILELNLKPY